MSFTDKDLKWLKNALAKPEYNQNISQARVFWILNRQDAMIFRMEAAEELIGINIGSTTYMERYEKWRKASGKP